MDSLRFGDLRIEGQSWAGDATWFRVHPPGLAFDVGRGALRLGGAQDLFITHGHLDHVLGVPFVLSYRSLHRSELTRVFCPASMARDLVELVEAAARLEGASYLYEVVPLHDGDRVELTRDLVVEAFSTDHVVPALGYHLVRRKHRLADRFRDFEQPELLDLKQHGTDIEVVEEELWVSYCGDSGPGVFDLEPRLYGSRVLLIECTFLADELRDRAARYKHLHIDDLAARQEEFRNEALVLHHLSRRHHRQDLERLVGERLPALADRIHILLGES